MLSFKLKIDKFLDALMKKDKRARRQMKLAMVRAMRDFEGHIIKKQMTGRPGLRRRTGTLANSWNTRVKEELGDIVVNLSTSVKYARPHQTGEILRRTSSGKKKYDFPKRLFVPESFDRNFNVFFSKELAIAIKEYEL